MKQFHTATETQELTRYPSLYYKGNTRATTVTITIIITTVIIEIGRRADAHPKRARQKKMAVFQNKGRMVFDVKDLFLTRLSNVG